jgi:hypothetical protein
MKKGRKKNRKRSFAIMFIFEISREQSGRCIQGKESLGREHFPRIVSI